MIRRPPRSTLFPYTTPSDLAGSGSDAFAMQTRAVDRGDHFVLNGRKLWITNGKEADIFVLFANANPEAGYRGITARSEEHTSELQSRPHLVCRLLLEKKNIM